jgi:acetyltransferase
MDTNTGVHTHKLDQIFNPRRIALIGISSNPNSVGGKVLINLVSGGFQGVVYPVNADIEAVMGIACFPSIQSLPKTPDLAILCTPASLVPETVHQCGEAGILGIIILSAGFREIGDEGKALEEQIRKEMTRFKELRIIGPNCLGIIVPGRNLNASFAMGMPHKGHIAFISQSGALCTSVLDWAQEGKIGFSYFVSIGNTLDVDFADLIDYFGQDDNTKSIILYVESIDKARTFMTAARAFARTKPILVYKAGRFPESAEAAASHTGAMAAEDAVYQAAFQRMGLARIYNIGDIFDCAELIGRHKIPRGPRLGIITNAGGPGVMASDALIASHGTIAEFSGETMAKLDESLPAMWSHRNPVDVLGDARSKRIAKAVKIVLDDPGVDAALIILTPQAMTNPTAAAKAVGELSQNSGKPILAAWLGGLSMRDGIRILIESGVATYRTPEQAVGAFMTLVAYARNLEILYETPKDIPVQFSLDRKHLRSQFNTLFAGKGEILTEDVSKKLLDAYGIPNTTPAVAKTTEEAVRVASDIGYPVVAKIFSPDISHKTDVGGVILNIQNENSLLESYDRILSNTRKEKPGARIDGITIQKMIPAENGLELITGIKKDPVFGSVIMIGMGGTAAEVFNDYQLGFPPLNERLARRMLESLRIWPLLQGFRGRPPADTAKLIEILIRISYLAADYPEIAEIDINPLLVTPVQVIALDARVILDQELLGKSFKPYSHLALRPYPEEYVQTATLRDGTEIILRPIKPEDEPMWFELLGGCSKESIYMRFRYFFHWETHEVAVRYCFNDYDREIAIVAELKKNGNRKLLGVGRMIADPDLASAEYAILVGDAWQNLGLGGLLTDYCIEIARKWGIKTMLAQTTSDNPRMVSVFRKRGFAIEMDPSTSLVEVSKNL